MPFAVKILEGLITKVNSTKNHQKSHKKQKTHLLEQL